MRPFEQDAYMDGWDARIDGAERNENPYRRPYACAWDSYRQTAWDQGWQRCDACAPLPAWYVDWHQGKRVTV